MYHRIQESKGLYPVLIAMAGFAVVGAFYFSYLIVHPEEVSMHDIDGGYFVGQLMSGKIMYLAAVTEGHDHADQGGAHGIAGTDLTILDPSSGTRKIVAHDIWSASLSSDKKNIITANSENKIVLYSAEGEVRTVIGKNGSNPIFTHDDKYIAYHKLADDGEDFLDLFENAKGIALYDIEKGTERMLTDNSGDDRPAGFSDDFKYFYFTAGRPYEKSVLGENVVNITSGIYVLEVDTGIVTRLTNTDEQDVLENGQTMSFIAHDALWTKSRQKVISGVEGHGIFIYTFDGEGGLIDVQRVSDGDSPQWIVQDKRFKVRSTEGGKEIWKTLTIE